MSEKPEDSIVQQSVAKGTSMGAAVLLVTAGVLEFLQGISAVAKDDVFVVGLEYTYKFDVTAWGWIHLVLGAIVAIIGAVLFTGATWARVGAVVVCAVSIIVNFLWLPYYPLWAILIIALNTVVIWAVTTWNPEKV
ncbi:hypothetical protein EGT67_17435 [Prescottella agglutinans]|uniref:DUF7144 domain-containing protein n=1 Tax=Prescottella agglutinans TaxID=1644129 RepID=A0A3S3E947_9NOCA|nr:hypothetical protein [Prescottella agglutinans]RVW08190.1 hypothetical protein EGT67_17435 [Prescottella agglutinans]